MFHETKSKCLLKVALLPATPPVERTDNIQSEG